MKIHIYFATFLALVFSTTLAAQKLDPFKADFRRSESS